MPDETLRPDKPGRTMSNSRTEQPDPAPVAVEQLRPWLTGRVAHYLELPVSQVDPDAGLIELGLDSVFAMALSGDVEDQLGLIVEPTLAWDHRTVNALADFLHQELERR